MRPNKKERGQRKRERVAVAKWFFDLFFLFFLFFRYSSAAIVAASTDEQINLLRCNRLCAERHKCICPEPMTKCTYVAMLRCCVCVHCAQCTRTMLCMRWNVGRRRYVCLAFFFLKCAARIHDFTFYYMHVARIWWILVHFDCQSFGVGALIVEYWKISPRITIAHYFRGTIQTIAISFKVCNAKTQFLTWDKSGGTIPTLWWVSNEKKKK